MPVNITINGGTVDITVFESDTLPDLDDLGVSTGVERQANALSEATVELPDRGDEGSPTLPDDDIEAEDPDVG
jgi:hypothetical protein